MTRPRTYVGARAGKGLRPNGAERPRPENRCSEEARPNPGRLQETPYRQLKAGGRTTVRVAAGVMSPLAHEAVDSGGRDC